MKYILLLISIISLAGCVPPQHQARWYKDGVSPEDAHNRHAKCVYDVGMNKIDGVLQEHTLIKACMESDGFRWGVPYVGGAGY